MTVVKLGVIDPSMGEGTIDLENDINKHVCFKVPNSPSLYHSPSIVSSHIESASYRQDFLFEAACGPVVSW